MKAFDSGISGGSGSDEISLTLRALTPSRLSADAETLA